MDSHNFYLEPQNHHDLWNLQSVLDVAFETSNWFSMSSLNLHKRSFCFDNSFFVLIFKVFTV